ncbi:MAG: hypothetical protein PHU06_09380 [Gallionella sp.]|nr:hypothetical protein [Gallionella sp.]MDD4959579.1 hypothetical protein [Gallionella sp.]
MNEITRVQPRKLNAKVLCCALGLMGVVSGGDAQCYDARADPMVPAAQVVGAVKYDKIVNECSFARTYATDSNEIAMIAKAQYAHNYEENQKLKVNAIEIVLKPKHGELELVTTAVADGRTIPSDPSYFMKSTDNYLGSDLAEYAVELSNGKRVLVRAHIYWVNMETDSFKQCPPTANDYQDMRRIQKEHPEYFQKAMSQSPVESVLFSAQNVKTITFCRDTESLSPDSGFNSFSPISEEFLKKIGRPFTGTDAEVQRYKVALLEMPKHGQARLVYEPSQHWAYVPEKGYQGADRAIYLVECQGKQYKVVINFWVTEVFDEGKDAPLCDSMDFGASNESSAPSSGLKPLSMSNFTAWQNEAPPSRGTMRTRI